MNDVVVDALSSMVAVAASLNPWASMLRRVCGFKRRFGQYVARVLRRCS